MACRPLNCFADDAGALVGRLEVRTSKAGNMDETSPFLVLLRVAQTASVSYSGAVLPCQLGINSGLAGFTPVPANTRLSRAALRR